MSTRQATYQMTTGVAALNVPKETIEEIVMDTVNKLYDENFCLRDDAFVISYSIYSENKKNRIVLIVEEQDGSDFIKILTKKEYESTGEKAP